MQRVREWLIMNLALNLAWQLNDTTTYSVTASQTCQSECKVVKVPSKRQSFFSLIEEKCWVIKQQFVMCITWSVINNLTTPCPIINVSTLQYRFTLGTAAMLSTLVHFYLNSFFFTINLLFLSTLCHPGGEYHTLLLYWHVWKGYMGSVYCLPTHIPLQT